MEPVEECLREMQVQRALEKGDYTAAMQRVEELKQKVLRTRRTRLMRLRMLQAMDESVEAVGYLCRMQLRTAELQIAHATGDLTRLRVVLAEVPLSAFMPERIKFVDDQTSAAELIQDNIRWCFLHEMCEAQKLFDFFWVAFRRAHSSKFLLMCRMCIQNCRTFDSVYQAGTQNSMDV